MALCSLCNDLEKKFEDDARLAFDFTPLEINKSVDERGCDSCGLIQVGLREALGPEYFIEKDVRRVYARCRGMHEGEPTTLTLEVYLEGDRPRINLEFFCLGDQGWKAVLPRTFVGKDREPQALDWAKTQLRICMKQHSICRKAFKAPLPKRVLSINGSAQTSMEVKLIENPDISALYAALSHCWGNHRTLITTRATLSDRTKRIEWDEIPKTYQQAILFAMEFDIHYVWIDSLCIIQDDSTDWEIESSKMSDIYQHSFLTLAATASSGDSQGCFPSTFTTTHNNVTHLPLELTDWNQVAVRTPLTHWDTSSPHRVAQDFPLLTRAWAFQERILSHRIVHFCGSELVWECSEACACECGNFKQARSPGGNFRRLLEARKPSLDWIRMIPLKSNDAPVYSQYHTPFQNLGMEVESSGISRQWRKLIEQYSSLHVTRPTDRLPAISGLCDRIQCFRGSYLAGLWSDSLELDLL